MNKRPALGRGLASLIPANQSVPNTTGLHWLNIEDIQPNVQQPRKSFAKQALQDLANSIQKRGVMQPILIRKAVGEGYEIIAGERRWRAAQLAGLKQVPVLIKEASDKESIELALVENLLREDLSPIEEAKAYTALLSEFAYSQEELAEKVERDRSTIANLIRLLKLPPEIQADIEAQRLSIGHARALLALETKAQQLQARDQILKQSLNVRQTENLVRKLVKGASHSAKSVSKVQSKWKHLQNELEQIFSTKVSIYSNRRHRGKIELEFYSLEDLDRLIEKLRQTP